MLSRARAHLTNRSAYLSLGLGVFAIGWSAILVRWTAVPGLVSAFYRLAFASMVFIPWRMYSPRYRLGTVPSGDGAVVLARRAITARHAAIIAGVFFGADLAFFNSAVMATTATNAALLGVNAPIFVAIGAWWMYGERPALRFWLGFLLALAGMIAIVGTDVVLHPQLGFGDLLAILGALCYAVYLLFVQRSRLTMDTLTFSVWSAAVGALCLLPVCLLFRAPLGGFSERSWAALVALALTTQVVGHVLVAHAMGRVPATLSSIVLLAQAPLTAILAWPLLGEPIRASQLVGGTLVLAGIMVVNVNRLSATTGLPSSAPGD